MQKVIIVGGDHHNTLGLVRAFGQAGYYVMLFVVAENNKSFVSYSKYVSKCCIVDDDDKVIELLLSRTLETSIRIPIITATDKSAENLDDHYIDLSKHYILANCSEKQGGISRWMNKEYMLKEASKYGLLQPFSLFVDSNTDFKADTTHVPFPCVVKPIKSSMSSKNDFRICNNNSELRDVLTDMTNRGVSTVIQEFINIEYEFLIIGARCRKTYKNHVVGGLHKHKCCKDINNMGMLVTAETTPDIPIGIDIAKLDAFLESIDYEGLYSVEFMISGDKAYFTEINLRNDGCLFCWTNAGCNIAVNWVREMTEDIEPIYNKIKRNNMLVEVSYLKYYWKNVFVMLKDFINSDAFAIYDSNDIKPFVYKFINAIKK